MLHLNPGEPFIGLRTTLTGAPTLDTRPIGRLPRVIPEFSTPRLRCRACGAESTEGDAAFNPAPIYPNGRWIHTVQGWMHACHGYADAPQKAVRLRSK